MQKNKHVIIVDAGLRIAKTAAFAFAILSWVATANGLIVIYAIRTYDFSVR
ncbi:hypothetical protein FACS18949_16000 [Clostridia bacterium]|nr:hypothetical protein FACS18949_16000 [Clostridia bacterium]